MVDGLFASILIPHLPAWVARREHACPPARPLVVATTTSDRGVVVAACPRGVHVGIHPGMPVGDARRRHWHVLVVVTPDAALDTACRAVEQVLHRYGDAVRQERAGLWSLELRALGTGFRHAGEVLAALHHDIQSTGPNEVLAGLGSTHVVATIAARWSVNTDTRRIVVLPGEELLFLAPLPVAVVPGIGPKGCQALHRLGVTTVGQLAALPASVARDALGPRAALLQRRAHGYDGDERRPPPQRISHRWRFEREACADIERLHAVAYGLAERGARDLRQVQEAAGTLAVGVCWADGRMDEHAERLLPRCDLDPDLGAAARRALDMVVQQRRLAVRHLTVTLGDLGPQQTSLLDLPDERARRRQQAIDAVKARYGTGAIRVAWLLAARRRRS